MNRRKPRLSPLVFFAVLLLGALLASCVSGGSKDAAGGANVGATSLACDPAAPSLAREQAGRGGRMKGVWVATITGDYPRQKTDGARALMDGCDFIVDECERLGFNAIFFQVRPSCDALYNSKYFPWSAWLTGQEGRAPQDGFDPLSYICKAARKKNIALHAWINPYRIKAKKGQTLADVLKNRPALKPLKKFILPCSDGNFYLDPGEPRVRSLIEKGAKEILQNYDVAGLHLDDYFYPQAGIDDSASYKKYGAGESLDDFRRKSVNALIKSLCALVHAQKKEALFGVSPFGIWGNKGAKNPCGSDTRGTESYSAHYADSIEWIKNGWLDYIVPQIYWERGHKAADYDALVRWWNEAVAESEVALYIGMADYKAAAALGDPKSPWRDGAEILEQMELNAELENVAGEIHFDFGSAEKLANYGLMLYN